MRSPEKGLKNYWFRSGGTSSLIMQYLKIDSTFDFINREDREISIPIKKLDTIYKITDIPTLCLKNKIECHTLSKKLTIIAKPHKYHLLLEGYFTLFILFCK